MTDAQLRFRSCVAVLGAALALAGCSSRQIYNAGAGWRQNECQKILESAERARCLESANTDYDTYEKRRGSPAEK